jgi:hypothetical protein
MFGGFNFEGMGGLPGMPGMDDNGKEKGPRLFQAQRKMPLPQAFHELGIDADWLPSFKESGEHYAQIRYKWRQAVLKFHPDRQPSNLSEADAAKNTAEYMKAMAAFESIDSFYATQHAEPVDQAWKADKAGGADTSGSSPRPTGEESGGGESAVGRSSAAAPAPAPAPAAAPPAEAKAPEPPKPGEAPELGTSKNAKDAVSRARSAPLFLRRRVEVTGLKAKPEFNGKRGKVTQFDRGKGRYAVELDNKEGSLQVRAANLKLADDDEEVTTTTAEVS